MKQQQQQQRGTYCKRLLLFFSTLSLLFLSATSQDNLRVNIGGEAYNDTFGFSWRAWNDWSGSVTSGTWENFTLSFPTTESTDDLVSDRKIFETGILSSTALTFNFSITPGRHFLRLYFCFGNFSQYPNYLASTFDVYGDGVTLLEGYSVIADAKTQLTLGSASGLYQGVLREFSLPLSFQTHLNVTFQPKPNSFVILNGIQIVSLPSDVYNPNGTKLGYPSFVPVTQDLQELTFATSYRLVAGLDEVSPEKDELNRAWFSIDNYVGINNGFQGIIRSQVPGFDTTPFTPEDILTHYLFSNASDVSFSPSLSFTFNTSNDSSYLVRLHFTEPSYFNSGSRVMNIQVNDQIVTTFDTSVSYLRAYYIDINVYLNVNESNSIKIRLTPTSSSFIQEVFINAIEILRYGTFSVSDSSSSLLPFPPPPPSPPPPPLTDASGRTNSTDTKKSSSNRGIILFAIILPLFLVLVILLIFLFFFIRRNKPDQELSVKSLGEIFRTKKKHESANSLSNLLQTPSEISGGSVASLGSNSSLRQFNLMELVKATNGFDRGMIIGEGGFGKVYKGKLEDQTLVAIKRAGIESAQGYAEFVAELILLSRVRHRNLVSLIGYSNENDEMIIVYEYMSRGTLRSHLYGTNLPPLPWKKRLEILLDAARGLSYLHSLRPNGIIHRDVKSTNILLDSDYVAKMSDFGLSKFGPSVDQTHVSTAVKGSFGYLDPEYFKRQKLTDKSDIYSFGVVMLEVLCARVPINPQLEHEEANLAEWALHYINNGQIESIIDKRMKGSWNLASVESFCQLLTSCLLERGADRPNMTSVIFLIQNCIRLLNSPNKSESPAF